jgi:hypothetical protein
LLPPHPGLDLLAFRFAQSRRGGPHIE